MNVAMGTSMSGSLMLVISGRVVPFSSFSETESHNVST